ncbi:MAG: hypothetical protein AMXMBFR44_1840 [Candidatus Campbellbacteria bacterium]
MGFEYFPSPVDPKKEVPSEGKPASPERVSLEEAYAPFTEESLLTDVSQEKSEKKESSVSEEQQKQQTPRVTKKYLEDRRIRLEEDEWLSGKEKKKLEGMIDELEEIHEGLKKKQYSPEEAKTKRAKKTRLARRLQTGAEAGVTKDAVETVRKEGDQGLKSVTRGQLNEALRKSEEFAGMEDVFSPDDIQKLKEKLQSAGAQEGLSAEDVHDGLTEKLPTEEKQPEEVNVQKEIEEVLEVVPKKEKPTWLRKIAGAGFGIQEVKNWAGEQAFGFAYKKFFESAVDAKKQGKELKGFEKARFETGLLVRSVARHYAEAKDVSEKNKEDFYAGKSKKMEWAKLAGEGVRAVRAVFAPMGMLRSPVWTLIALSRISETVKEHRFEKKKYDESSDEVAEDAMAMYEEAQKEARAAGRDVPTADDIARVYAKGVIRGTLESGTGTLTKTAAGLGVKKLIEPVFKEMQTVESDVSLSAEEKQMRLTALARKNEKLIKEVDLLVDRTGSVDAVAYRLRQAGVWTKRLSTALAIETIAEMGYHLAFDSIAEGADAHTRGAEVSSLKRPLVASVGKILEHSGETQGLDLEGVEVPVPPVTIEHGGNIWSSAKDIAEKAGLSKEQFAAAWGESTVKLPDGRIVPIAELNLVHEGDTLSYVPGEGDAAGHFEFNNESHIAYGDTLNLPGAQEGEVISKMNFEQEGHPETFDSGSENVEKLMQDYPELTRAQAEKIEEVMSTWPGTGSITEYEGAEPEQVFSEKTAGTPVDRLAEMGIEKYSADVVDKELRWYFGQKYGESDVWKGVRDMSARKFSKMAIEEDAKKLEEFKSYLDDLGKKTGTRPVGGLFRRDETVLEYFARVRRALIEQQSAGK